MWVGWICVPCASALTIRAFSLEPHSFPARFVLKVASCCYFGACESSVVERWYIYVFGVDLSVLFVFFPHTFSFSWIDEIFGAPLKRKDTFFAQRFGAPDQVVSILCVVKVP